MSGKNHLNRWMMELNQEEDRLLQMDWKCHNVEDLNKKIYIDGIIMEGSFSLFPQYYSTREHYPFMFGERTKGKSNVRRRSKKMQNL